MQANLAPPGKSRNMQLLESLRRQHPVYQANRDRWRILRAIAAGGAQAEAVKEELLVNPDGRGSTLKKARAEIAPLVNKIGPVIARFVAQLFVDTPKFEGAESQWFETFEQEGARLPDDSDQRASLVQLLDRAMFMALAEGAAIVQVDTRTSSGSLFLAGQEQSGELDPYAVLWDRDALWDWEPGENGLQAVKLHQFKTFRTSILGSPQPEHVFTIFEREEDSDLPNGFRVLGTQYRVRRIQQGETPIRPEPFIEQALTEKEFSIEATQLSNGSRLERVEIFNRNREYEFPIIVLSLPGFLCIGEQLLGLQKEHFNNRSSLNWAILRANYAMPFIKGGEEDPFKSQKAGDGYYLWLPDDDIEVGSFSVNSPAIPSSSQKEETISKDIYETLQQMAYLAAQTPAALSRSEESRRKDEELERILLLRQGSLLKDFAAKIVRCAKIAANDSRKEDISVEGFQKFKTSGLLSYLPLYQGLNEIGDIPVPAFKRMRLRDTIRLYGTTMDHSSEEIQDVINEVDDIPESELMQTGQPPESGSGNSPDQG